MKLILAIVNDRDSDNVSRALISQDFRVTRIASSGGFWRRGSTTFLIGVDENQVDPAISVIRDSTSIPDESGSKRATMFVLNVNSFVQV